MRIGWRAVAMAALGVIGCGGSTPAARHAAPAMELEPQSILLEIARASSARSLFEAPQSDAQVLEERLSEAADAERGERMWDLARARLAWLEEAYTSRPGLESAIHDAVQEREAAVRGLRERRVEEERLAREAAEAAERERGRLADEAVQRVREEAERERARQDDEFRRRTAEQGTERDRRDAEFRRRTQDEAAERARRDAAFARRQDTNQRQAGGADEDARERERQRQDDAFRRRAEAAERRRQRRAAGDDKSAPRAKQSRRSRRRRAARQRRARRGRRAGHRERRRPTRARSDEREPEWSVDDVDQDLLRDGDREALQRLAEQERDARAQLHQAEATIEEEQRELGELVRRAQRASVSDEVKARIEFALVWAAWRTGLESAAELAERFTEAHPSAGDLLALAWMIRGEAAAAAHRPDDSLAAFRFGMNRLGEPIYAYSLWRSASVQEQAGDASAARESLLGVEQEGCVRETHELVRRLSHAAASALGHDLRLDPDGVTRPETCSVPEAREEESGWRPEE